MYKIKTNKKGETFIMLTKKEFDEKYIVGCLDKYESNGKPNSIVKIKIHGEVPDMKNCVVIK